MKRTVSLFIIICVMISSAFTGTVTASENTVNVYIASDSCEVVYGNGNNRNTIYVYNSASTPMYALYKLDIGNLPRADRIKSAKLKISVNGVRSGTISYVAAKKSVQTDWGERENGYSYKGSEGFIQDTKIPNLGEQIGEPLTIASAGVYEFDITDYAVEKKKEGADYLVVGLENIGTTEALFYSHSTSSGDSNTKPKFEFEFLPAEELNSISEITVSEGAVVSPIFDKNITDYVVAYPDTTEEMPVISYVAEGAYCTEKENIPAGAFGETTVITLTSEAGIDKTYRFKILKYKDLGVSPDGEITYEKPVVSTNGENVEIKVSVNSLSTVNKNVYIVTSVTVGGKVTVYAEPWTVHTGYNEKITSVPSGEDVISFVMEDFKKFIPLSESASLVPLETPQEKYDETTVFYKKLEENKLTISGKTEKDKLINFFITDSSTHPMNVNDITNLYGMNAVRCDNNGYYSVEFTFFDEGTYNLYGVDDEGKIVVEKEIFFCGYDNRKQLAEQLYESDDLINDMFLSDSSETVKKFSLKKDDYESVSETYFYTILRDIFSKSVSEDKLKSFYHDFKTALNADKLNSGKIEDVASLFEMFCVSENVRDMYNNLTNELKRKISMDKMKGKNFPDISSIETELKKEIVLININEPDSLASLISFIEAEYENLGLSTDLYYVLNGAKKISLAQYISEKTYSSVGEFVSDFNQKVNNLFSEPNISGGGSSGGGSGGGGGSVSTPVEIKKEIVNTPEVPAEELSEMKVSDFTDLEGYDWAKKDIFAFYTKGIISGKSEKNFAPGDNITRGEIIKIISGVFDLYDENAKSDFKDLENHWAEKYVSSVFGKGYILGKSENVFGVDDYITREDAAVIIYRIIQTTAKATTITKIENSFSDRKEISEYAVRSVEMLSEYGLLKGYEDGSFKPKKTLTRAEAVVLLSNVLKYLNVE